jgi:two-component system chemotaxis sensor kinase CheA
MSRPDPVDTFRQEARELLEQLEQGLLDLEQRPGDSDLINSTFRALHTIKGSGAMFGFTAVAAFVHEFETAFDRVRKGEAAATPKLVSIALDAKDHVHKLIENPEAPVEGGEEILATLRELVANDSFPEAPFVAETPESPVAAASGGGRWHIRFRLPKDALVYGTNPLLLLEEIATIGPCEIRALTDTVPPLDGIDPEVPYVGWDVLLDAEDPRAAIDDVFMFLRDGMELTVEPMAAPEPDPVPVPAKKG